MKYEYILIVRNTDNDGVVAEITKTTLEMLEENFRAIEEKVAKYEADKKLEEQEENICGGSHNNGDDNCLECEVIKRNI